MSYYEDKIEDKRIVFMRGEARDQHSIDKQDGKVPEGDRIFEKCLQILC